MGNSLRRSGRLARSVSAGGVRGAVREGGRGLAAGHCRVAAGRGEDAARSARRGRKRTCDSPGRRASTFKSVANQARFVLARDALAKSADTLSPEERQRLQAEIKRRLESEIALARQLFTLVREDSRIGFEPSCQYFYLPLDLVEKVVNCRWLLGQLEE